MKNIVIAIYTQPEYYPPTLNALEYLSAEYDNIYVVHRNYITFDWVYPSNVNMIPCGKLVHVREAEAWSLSKKTATFLAFTQLLRKTIIKHAADTVLIYDFMPVLSYRLLRPFIRKPRVLWYHNHDVADGNALRKYSLSWFAWKSENWIFPSLNVFSLPAQERKAYFPMEWLKGKFFFIPNFPSRKIYDAFRKPKQTGDTINILYQGSIGPLHGLEEIIPLLNQKINDKSFRLLLKGFISNEYLLQLKQLAQENNTADRLEYIPPSGYREVITNASGCHIGIGIHKKQDIMNSTLGTASNKIYEYAAVGMPVLLYDNEHFRSALQGREWAIFTDTSKESLLKCLHYIVDNYDELSAKASKDFAAELCFENYFQPVIGYLQQIN